MPTTQAIAERLLAVFQRSLDGDLNEVRNIRVQHFINIAIGITYGIARAQSLNFDPHAQDARRPPMSIALYKQSREQVLNGLISGSPPSDSHWTGGYYFNSSLYRMDALAQVLSKFIFADKERPRDRGRKRSRAEQILINSHLILRQIANERNQLDHQQEGLMFKRRIFYCHLLEGLSLLVDLLEQQVDTAKDAGHPKRMA